VYVGGQPAKDAGSSTPEPLGPGQPVPTRDFRQVLPAFERAALQSLGRTVVSPDDQETVRRYFSQLQVGTG
ncbi:MAG: hypothetical protein ACRDZQ_15755, partial [Acidimicrobiales bacterium]